MYNCQCCGELQQPNTPSVVVVAERRLVIHRPQKRPMVFKAHGKREKRFDLGGQGSQITKELKVCLSCAKRYEPA